MIVHLHQRIVATYNREYQIKIVCCLEYTHSHIHTGSYYTPQMSRWNLYIYLGMLKVHTKTLYNALSILFITVVMATTAWVGMRILCSKRSKLWYALLLRKTDHYAPYTLPIIFGTKPVKQSDLPLRN